MGRTWPSLDHIARVVEPDADPAELHERGVDPDAFDAKLADGRARPADLHGILSRRP